MVSLASFFAWVCIQVLTVGNFYDIVCVRLNTVQTHTKVTHVRVKNRTDTGDGPIPGETAGKSSRQPYSQHSL